MEVSVPDAVESELLLSTNTDKKVELDLPLADSHGTSEAETVVVDHPEPNVVCDTGEENLEKENSLDIDVPNVPPTLLVTQSSEIASVASEIGSEIEGKIYSPPLASRLRLSRYRANTNVRPSYFEERKRRVNTGRISKQSGRRRNSSTQSRFKSFRQQSKARKEQRQNKMHLMKEEAQETLLEEDDNNDQNDNIQDTDMSSSVCKFRCAACKDNFNSSGDLCRHIVETHSNDVGTIKYLQCAVCSVTFTKSTNLRRHVNEFHTNRAFFKCTKCTYCATRKSSLRIHHDQHLRGGPKRGQKGKHHFAFASSVVNPQTAEVRTNNLSCHLCTLKIADMKQLIEHLASDHRMPKVAVTRMKSVESRVQLLQEEALSIQKDECSVPERLHELPVVTVNENLPKTNDGVSSLINDIDSGNVISPETNEPLKSSLETVFNQAEAPLEVLSADGLPDPQNDSAVTLNPGGCGDSHLSGISEESSKSGPAAASTDSSCRQEESLQAKAIDDRCNLNNDSQNSVPIPEEGLSANTNESVMEINHNDDTVSTYAITTPPEANCTNSSDNAAAQAEQDESTQKEGKRIILRNRLRLLPQSSPNHSNNISPVCSSTRASVKTRLASLRTRTSSNDSDPKVVQPKAEQKARAYICNSCHQNFISNRHLYHHLRVSHDKTSNARSNTIREQIEPEVVAASKIEPQQDSSPVHEPLSDRTCPICRISFKQRRYVSDHLRRIHGVSRSLLPRKQSTPPPKLDPMSAVPRIPRFKCGVCAQRFVDVDEARNHLKEVHQNKSPLNSDKKGEVGSLLGQVPPVLQRESSLPLGRVAVSPIKDPPTLQWNPVLKIKLVSRSANPLVRKNDDSKRRNKLQKKFLCPYCKRIFGLQSVLIRHVRIHTGEKPHQCPHCSYAAGRKYQVTSHIELRHAKEVNNMAKKK